MCACANKGEKFLGLNSPLLLCFVFGGDNPLNSCFDELFVMILIHKPSAKPPGIASSHELEFFTFLRKPQSTLIFPRILKIL